MEKGQWKVNGEGVLIHGDQVPMSPMELASAFKVTLS